MKKCNQLHFISSFFYFIKIISEELFNYAVLFYYLQDYIDITFLEFIQLNHEQTINILYNAFLSAYTQGYNEMNKITGFTKRYILKPSIIEKLAHEEYLFDPFTCNKVTQMITQEFEKMQQQVMDYKKKYFLDVNLINYATKIMEYKNKSRDALGDDVVHYSIIYKYNKDMGSEKLNIDYDTKTKIFTKLDRYSGICDEVFDKYEIKDYTPEEFKQQILLALPENILQTLLSEIQQFFNKEIIRHIKAHSTMYLQNLFMTGKVYKINDDHYIISFSNTVQIELVYDNKDKTFKFIDQVQPLHLFEHSSYTQDIGLNQIYMQQLQYDIGYKLLINKEKLQKINNDFGEIYKNKITPELKFYKELSESDNKVELILKKYPEFKDPKYQDKNTGLTMALLLANLHIIPPKELLHDPSIKSHQGMTVMDILNFYGIYDIPKEWICNKEFESADIKFPKM